MKRLITVLGIALLIGIFAIPALARGPGWGRWGHMRDYRGGGPGYCPYYDDRFSGLTAEQHEKLDQIYKKHYDDTAQLRNDVWAKRAELNTLLNSSTPDAEKAKALQKEISDLRGQLAQMRVDLRLEEKKIAPEAGFSRGYGRGYYGKHRGGHGPGMMGPGYGPGMGRGYGPGPCW